MSNHLSSYAHRGDAHQTRDVGSARQSSPLKAKTARTRRVKRRNAAQRRGTAAVEFAVVAPVFIALVFGILEIGRLVMVQQMLTTASREGARLAVTESATLTSVQSAVDTYLTNGTVTGATTTVTPTLSSAQPGDTIIVQVQMPFDDASWLPTPWFVHNTTLTATSAMRREGIP
jgi:Flp pilus assembly protein TadG